MHGEQDAAEHLLLRHHVPDERARIAARAHGARALRVHRTGVLGEPRILEVQPSLVRERRAHAARARGQHAVEHVHARRHGAHQRGGIAHAHQVARLAPGHVLGHERLQRLEHGLVFLAHGVPADAIARKVAALLQVLERAQAQIQVHTALHDAEERLVRARVRRVAPLGPHAGEFHGARHEAPLRRVARALVQLHADIAPELLRDRHVVLRRPEHVAAVVIRGDEAHAVVRELHGVLMREHLKAAGIREDGPVPVHERVQAAQLGDGVRAGTHSQVVRVGEHDLGTQVPHRLGGDALDVGLGAHRHEDRRGHVAVRGMEHARARMRLGVLGDDIVGEQALVHESSRPS